MLTAIATPQEISETPVTAQVETLPSDAEISKRVLRIRSQWSLSERVRRRQEAEKRFNDLLSALAEAA